MKCPNCGAEIPDIATFCPECGATINKSETAKTEEKPDKVPEIQEVPSPTQKPNEERDEEKNGTEKHDKPKAKHYILLTILVIVLGIIGVVSLPCLIIAAALLAFRIYKKGKVKTVGNIILIVYIVLAVICYLLAKAGSSDSTESSSKESAAETHIETTTEIATQAETFESTTAEQPETSVPETTQAETTAAETTAEAVKAVTSNIPLEDIVGIYTCYAAGDNFYLELQKVDESTLSMHVWLYSENEGESSDIDTVTMKTADGNVWKGSGTEGEYSFYYGENDGFLHVSYPGLGDLDFLMADSEDEIPYPDGSTLAPVLEQETIPNSVSETTTAAATIEASNEYRLYLRLFDAPYPQDFSKDRNEIFKLMQDMEGKSFKTDSIKIEKKIGFGPDIYKQTLDSGEFRYFGDVKDGKPDGKGLLFWAGGGGSLYYAGGFKDGLFSGYGILFSAGHISEEGEFSKGEHSGKGIRYSDRLDEANDFEYRDINTDLITDYDSVTFNYITPLPMVAYEGDFKKGKADGKGKSYYSRTSTEKVDIPFLPEDKDSVYNVYISLQDDNYGQIAYSGEYADDERDGKGTAYYSDGTKKYEGGWRKGSYDGKGTLYNEDGSVKYKGTFQNGDIK